MGKIAIIPARGGSKRIPRKNIKDFLGKPIIAYSIEVAIKSRIFDAVMVSTDDEEIAAIAKFYGADVPFFRSKKNSDDTATTVDVILEVIAEFKKQKRYFDTGCCIYPTAPLINEDLLLDAYDLMVEKKYDSVFPVVRFSYPIWRSLKLEGTKSEMFWPEYLNSRSQDLPDAYHDAGQFYWFKYDQLLKNNTVFTKNAGSIILSESEVQDIDSMNDWILAEIKYKVKKDSL